MGLRNLSFDILHKEIYNDILDGATYSTIINKILEGVYQGAAGYKYSRKSAEKLIADVRKVIRADFEAERGEMKERLSVMLLDVYTEARENGDRQAALKAIDQLAKYSGVDEFKVNATVTNKITIDFGFDTEEEDGDTSEVQSETN